MSSKRAMKVWTGRVRAGSGAEAVSDPLGDERGVPLLRWYTQRFLEEFAADVQGRCLEFSDAACTRHYGAGRVAVADVIDVTDSNPEATVVADLTRPNDVPGDRYDCAICMFVLHLVYDYEAVVRELHRLLKPGGVLLVVVPATSPADPGWHEMWRFTPEGLDRLLRRHFGDGQVLVRAYGNSLTAAGQMRGLAAEDFRPDELAFHDPRFAVLACGRAVRAGGSGNGHVEPPPTNFDPTATWDRYRP